MEKARVAVFEDSIVIRSLLRQILEVDSHMVTFEAATVQEAIEVIEALEEGDIDVALVDGNLDGLQFNGRDGELIASLLRRKLSQVVVIGISATHDIPSAHINIDKLLDSPKLGRMISDMPDTTGLENS